MISSLQVTRLLRPETELWDLFTRKEEYQPLITDHLQRFPYFASDHRNVFFPEASAFLARNGLAPSYPEDRPFAVCLTHDIDVLHYAPLRVGYEAAMALRRLEPAESLKALVSPLSKRANRLWCFRKMMDVERKYGARSTFFFLALEKGELDKNYSLGELREEMQEILRSGCEIGLHGSHEAHCSLDLIKREKGRLEEVLGKPVIGYRNHFLRFAVPTTWECIQAAGFEYDATFGYHDCIGFRNGMCHPFRPFNVNTDRQIDLLEIPLAVMDLTLSGYMRVDTPSAWELIRSMIDSVAEVRGVFNILWHNTQYHGEMLELYERILAYCHEKNAWIVPAAEVAGWWKRLEEPDGA